MDWYLKKEDNTVYGPVPLVQLQTWAEDGRIAPQDRISDDQQKWIVPSDYPDLAMDWMVALADGSEYGPINLLALREPVKSGEIGLHAVVTHKESKTKQTVAMALAQALLEENDELRSRLNSLHQAAAPQESGSGSAPANHMPADWREAAERGHIYEKEARKWKRMYEEERADLVQREESLKEQVRDAKQREITLRTKIEQAEQHAKQIEKNYDLLKRAGEGGFSAAQFAALLESHNELAQNYENILTQLTERSEEIQTALASRDQIQQDATQRVRLTEERLQREQEEADKARKRLADMEQSHLQLLRSYRDMNDRFIQSRQQAGTASGKA